MHHKNNAVQMMIRNVSMLFSSFLMRWFVALRL
nr:MAG TPA: hypothetical protein [Caudovirales sp. ctNII2]